MPNKVVFLAIEVLRIWWYFLSALILDELLELLNTVVFDFHALFSVPIDPIVSFELFLELDDGFVPLIESTCESDHDVPLLQ